MTYLLEIIRNRDNGSCITRLPGASIPFETFAACANCLAQIRAAGIQGQSGDCNDVAVVFTKNGKRIGWLSREVFHSFKNGKDLKSQMTKQDTFGYNQPENVL